MPAAQLSASRDAAVAVLGSFREVAYDEPAPAGVLRRMARSRQRHLRERSRAEHPSARAGEPESPVAEEFVTVLLLQIAPAAAVTALNCGRPWPYRLHPPDGPPGPVRPADLRPQSCGALGPGELLVLHTRGAEDARDRQGRFFPLRRVMDSLVREPALTPARLVAGVHAALLRHTRGRLADDVALLVLRNDRAR
ncbi:PP2C family protein-serine/threonine phosphatase [Streptomyces sp. NPDC029003]|uniref:PP2C family protein-serine/threonine phosphatase n=1 Tax=Streptomyces sp. NPDC029003 TaxID=3155125 RepID=UPI0033FAE109